MFKSLKKLSSDKKGVFGLTAVQQFFAVILGLALLAYVIVVIMGTLSGASIMPQTGTTVVNETTGAAVTEVAGTVAGSATQFNGLNPSCSVSACRNATDGRAIPAANFTATGCNVRYTGASAAGKGFNDSLWKCDYTVRYDTPQVSQTTSILANTSTGISSFFGAINPVYAILAILVIILVLVVLVRVVQAPAAGPGMAPGL